MNKFLQRVISFQDNSVWMVFAGENVFVKNLFTKRSELQTEKRKQLKETPHVDKLHPTKKQN